MGLHSPGVELHRAGVRLIGDGHRRPAVLHRGDRTGHDGCGPSTSHRQGERPILKYQAEARIVGGAVGAQDALATRLRQGGKDVGAEGDSPTQGKTLRHRDPQR